MSNFDMILDFHEKLNKARGWEESPDPELRKALIQEECAELIEAIDKGDKAAILKEACDLLYVTYGAGVTFDLPIDRGYKRVHESNMSKLIEPEFREDGKLLKGRYYFAPYLEDLVVDGIRRRS